MQACKKIAEKLHLLPLNKPSILVAGTNGKGSTVAALSSIFIAAGYRVASFYSPHLFHFNERIQINQQPVSQLIIDAAFRMIDSATQNKDLTYFERATLAALSIFQRQNIDVYILEVGLGGRFDATNMIEPDVSVITSIDLDHTEILGKTREEIAIEKAGIMRPNKPVIYGEANIPKTIFDCAEALDAKLMCYQRDYFMTVNENFWSYRDVNNAISDIPKPNIYLPNAAAAVAAIKQFTPLSISHADIRKGLAHLSVPGRFHIIHHPVRQIFDVAHNPAAVNLLASRIRALPITGKTYAVLGALKDKDIANLLKPFLSLIDTWYFGGLDHERGLPAEDIYHIYKQLMQHDIENVTSRAVVFDTIQQAYQTCLQEMTQDDQVVIYGSFSTVGATCPDKNL